MSAGLNRKTKADTVGGSASISQKHTNIAGELLNYTNFLYVEMTGKTAHAERPAEIRASRYVDILSRIALETVRESCRASDMRLTTMSIHGNKLNAAMNLCVEHDLLHEHPRSKIGAYRGGKKNPRAGTLEDFSKLFPVLPP